MKKRVLKAEVERLQNVSSILRIRIDELRNARDRMAADPCAMCDELEGDVARWRDECHKLRDDIARARGAIAGASERMKDMAATIADRDARIARLSGMPIRETSDPDSADNIRATEEPE